ncbi:hypothetical protein, partial [Pseudomonas sp. UBA4034]|uniref:hypothetical protein n=1 Tax=Pseudomonas sp. UBA4034 TaxID=1947315 RepID=UPI002579C78B
AFRQEQWIRHKPSFSTAFQWKPFNFNGLNFSKLVGLPLTLSRGFHAPRPSNAARVPGDFSAHHFDALRYKPRITWPPAHQA